MLSGHYWFLSICSLKMSIPFKFPCSHCGQRLSVPDELFGKSIHCPICSKKLVVPDRPSEPVKVVKTLGASRSAKTSKSTKAGNAAKFEKELKPEKKTVSVARMSQPVESASERVSGADLAGVDGAVGDAGVEAEVGNGCPEWFSMALMLSAVVSIILGLILYFKS